MKFKLNNKKQIQLDKEELRKLGYIQELNRSIGVFSNFALSFSVISILTGLIILYGDTLGGTGTYELKSWLWVGAFQLVMAMCLGEISSCYPIAGGVYKWTSILGNRTIGWFNGCISLFGWICCVAGINYGLSKFSIELFTGVPANSSKFNLIFVFVIMVLFQTLLSTFGIKLITRINNLSVIVHISGVLAITILLLVFTKASNNMIHLSSIGNPLHTPWKNYIPSLLMSAWTLTAFDASASISEETINPTKTVSYGMILSVAVSILFGSMLLFSLGQASASIVIKNPASGTMALYIIETILGSTVTKFISLIMILAMFICGLACQTVTVRIIYALSRDKGIPLSDLWKNVAESYGTPVFSNILCGILEISIIVIISILEYTSMNTSILGEIPTRILTIITSLSTVGIYFSYAIVTFCALLNRHRIKQDHGEFTLGRSGITINICSFIWALFVTLVILFYFNSKTTELFLGFLFFLVLYYLLSIKKELLAHKVLSERELIDIENMKRWGNDDK